MLPEITCTITANDKVVESITQVTDFQHLYECLDKFELELNATITKLLRNNADDFTADCNFEEENEDSDGEDPDKQISPKKKKIN